MPYRLFKKKGDEPDFSGYLFWKEALIWGTYVPGWTLILLASMDKEEKR